MALNVSERETTNFRTQQDIQKMASLYLLLVVVDAYAGLTVVAEHLCGRFGIHRRSVSILCAAGVTAMFASSVPEPVTRPTPIIGFGGIGFMA